MSKEIETIEMDLEDLELIEKYAGTRYDFPVVSVCTVTVHFNKFAMKYVPEYFKWFINDEWCVLKACDPNERNAYKSRTYRSGDGSYEGKAAFLPKGLEGAVTFRGAHKLYKTKDGVAFKKHEFVGGKTK